MMTNPGQKYDREFKKKVVELSIARGNAREVVGMAASIANKHNTNPGGVYKDHLSELKELMNEGVGKYNVGGSQNYNLGGTLGPKELETQDR